MTVHFLQKAEIYTGGCPPYYITFCLKYLQVFLNIRALVETHINICYACNHGSCGVYSRRLF